MYPLRYDLHRLRYTNPRTKKKSRDIIILEDGELKGYRLQLNLSRKEMADKLGISHRTLEALENGRRDARTTIARLAWLMVEYQRLSAEYKNMAHGRDPKERPIREILEGIERKLNKILADY